MLESFVAAVAAHAASEVNHTLNASDSLLSETKAEAREFAASIITQTAMTISGTIESAIYGRGSTRARADQVRRAVGLSDSQVNALDRMQERYSRFYHYNHVCAAVRVQDTPCCVRPVPKVLGSETGKLPPR